MKENFEVEFYNIVNDILKNDEFIELKYEDHHGITRMRHSLNVAKLTFKLCKRFNVKNIKDTTRAALLHDFFKTNEIKKCSFLEHPLLAANNAKRVFDINDFQSNIIKSHMYPMCKVFPKSRESYIVSIADKIVAIKECTRYKVPLTIGTAMLFFFNSICVQR